MKFLIRSTRVHSITTTRKQGNHGCPGNWYLRPSVDGGRKCFIKVTVLKYSERGSLGEINILRFLGDARYFMYVLFFFLVLHTSFDLTPFIQVPEASARQMGLPMTL